MNKKKGIMTGAILTVCAVFIASAAFALTSAAARPMETSPVVTEASAAGLISDLNVVAVAARADDNSETTVLVQGGTVTVSGEDNVTWKSADESLEFVSGFEPVAFSVEDGIVSVSGQGSVTWNVSDEGGLGAIGGFEPTFIEGIPGEDDIAAETAVETATRAIQDKYALTDRTLARFTIEALLNVANPDEPVWSVGFNPANNNYFSEIGTYHVTINARTGEILNILSAADGIG